MDADWYEDPLGRFDGRFFDGEKWTEQVSSNGRLDVDSEFHEGTNVDSVGQPRLAPPQVGMDDGVAASAANEMPAFAEPAGPAVEPVVKSGSTQASMLVESPARVVAVLDESMAARQPLTAETPARSTRGPLVVVLLLAVIAALGIGAYVMLTDDSADLDAAQEDRVADLEDGGTADDVSSAELTELEPDQSVQPLEPRNEFDADEAVQVGASLLVNGASVLDELESWHTDFAQDRGVELGPDSGCWFGQLAGAAIQVAQCGPVGGSADTEYLFDRVPLVFENADGGQLVQPVVEAVVPDAVVANGLTLIGAPDSAPPPGAD